MTAADHGAAGVGAGTPTSTSHMANDIASIGVLELLKEDQRPSCVVDLHPQNTSSSPGQSLKLPILCYRNARFTDEYDFDLHGSDASPVDSDRLYFRSWAFSRLTQDARSTINCHGLSWVATTIKKRWKIIQATTPTSIHSTDDSDSDVSHHELKHAGVLGKLPKGSAEAHHEWMRGMMQKASPHDWTAVIRPRRLSDHILYLREWDWSQTPLGPLESWSPRLRLMANLIMCDPNPAVLFWGPELAGIYNEPYVPLLHDKHPKALGEPYHRTWSELYRQEDVAKVLDDLWTKNIKGEPIMWTHRTFYLRNGNRLQEHIFNMSFLPIIDEDGKTLGFYEPVKEVTRDALSERRARNIRSISECSNTVDTLENFFRAVVKALESNGNDVPFAMLYSIRSSKVDWKRPFSLNHAIDNGLARLESSLGLPVDAHGQPIVHAGLMKHPGFLRAFETVCKTGRPEPLNLEKEPELAANMLQEPALRGFGDQPRLSVMIPIEPITHKGMHGVLYIGTNTRRPYDADYEEFVRDLARSISSSLASLLLYLEQKRRVGEALQKEKRAVSMLEASPVGCCLHAMDSTIIYANSAWTRITDWQFDDHPFSWVDMLAAESVAKSKEQWDLLMEHRVERTFELALKKPWVYKDPSTGEVVTDGTHVLVSALVQTIGEDDFVISVMTDISYQKWMEALQDQRRREALEMKRVQERFVDMTSHEMRNPLSAIFQCADAIVNSLSLFQPPPYGMPDLTPTANHKTSAKPKMEHDPKALGEAVSHAIENASIITLCAQHQRRIVDDVLILSKVDANLIEIHPIDVQPQVLIENAIKMFTAELAANKASMKLEIEPSFEVEGINWVKLDPGRVLQILINLCTNAIKFSMDSTARQINISLGASKNVPHLSSRGVRYLTTPSVTTAVNDDERFSDPTVQAEWGDGDPLYLEFQVSDTGQGMTDQEMKMLFNRFKQASPRTHTVYGGSGLGLYIARLLSRLQGGEIGVTSVAGHGSTFAFYVKVRRAETPHGADVHAVVPQVNLPVGMHGPESPSLEEPAGAKKKEPSEVTILIVEDNLVNQRVLARQLKQQGFNVLIANHGAECLDLVRKSEWWIGDETTATENNSISDGNPIADSTNTTTTTATHNRKQSRSNTHSRNASVNTQPSSTKLPISLILMDIEMPIMSGLIAAAHIRSYETSGALSKHIPIIAITANARLEQIQVAREAGMDEVVSKPFRLPELLGKCEAFLW